MRASIVIPSWNGKALLQQNLPFLFEALRSSRDCVEVIIVEDGGSDDTAAFLRSAFPDITVIVHETNRGFSQACRSGVLAAQGEVVVLLNNDVQLCNNVVDLTLPYFERDDTFAVSPLIFDENNVFQDISLRVPYLRRGKMRFRPVRDIPAEPCYTLFCSGGSVAYSRAKFLELGGFNPLYYPFYYEDQELGFRAWRRGWKSYVDPEARIIHPVGKTIRTRFEKKRVARISKRNQIMFSFNNFFTAGIVFPGVLLPLVAKLSYKWLTFNTTYYYSFVAALSHLPEILRQRKQEKQCRVLTEEEIFFLIENHAGSQTGSTIRNNPAIR